MTTAPPALERACPLCQQQAFQPLYRPRRSPGAVVLISIWAIF
ncbi:MAG: hypothetical protein AB1894_04145 [Chloroflexota bacterium]